MRWGWTIWTIETSHSPPEAEEAGIVPRVEEHNREAKRSLKIKDQ